MSTTTIASLVLWIASRLVVYEPAILQYINRDVSENQREATQSKNTETNKHKLIVAIDPGHGGTARGACSPTTRMCEKGFTLHLALKAKEALETIPGVKAILTRNEDTDLSLYHRSDIAKMSGAGLFISLHANASPKRDQQGFEVFVYPPSPSHGEMVAPFPEDPFSISSGDWQVNVILSDLNGQVMRNCSLEYGGLLLEEMEKNMLGRQNRGLKQKGLAVLSRLEMPGILVEVGFLDHPYEGRLLLEGKFQKQILNALKSSVMRWLQRPTEDKCRKTNLHHANLLNPEHKKKEEHTPNILPHRRRLRRKKQKLSPKSKNAGQNAPWLLSPKEKDGLLVLNDYSRSLFSGG